MSSNNDTLQTTGCAKKKERHFKYICKVASN